MSWNKVGVRILDSTGTQVVDPLTNTELRAEELDTISTSDKDMTHVCQLVTTAGDTVLYTPQLGKRIRLQWVYAINDPVSETSTLITIKLGTAQEYVAWALSKKQRVTGGIDQPLIINLSVAGNVAVTVLLEEV